jgi:dihydrofolate reductase
MAGLYRCYIAVSLDGYIATPDGGVGWLSAFEGHDYGYERFVAGIAGLIMGRATFDQVMDFGHWPYGSRPTAVLTSQPLPKDAPNTAIACSSVGEIRQHSMEFGGDIWIVGGGLTVAACAQADMVDRLELFILPVVLRRGLPLFTPDFPTDRDLRLEGTWPRDGGAVEAHYGLGTTDR